MKIIINKPRDRLFNHLSQRNNKRYKMACTIFWASKNLAYNKWIVINYRDININLTSLEKKWKRSEKNWAYWIDWFKEIATNQKENFIYFSKNESAFDYLLDEWYAITIWISVNKEFFQDYIDWKITKYKDYFKYIWNKGHFINIFKENDKYFILDNYSLEKDRANIIEINIFEIKDIMFNTCFCFT